MHLVHLVHCYIFLTE